jgi:hypothetical protein
MTLCIPSAFLHVPLRGSLTSRVLPSNTIVISSASLFKFCASRAQVCWIKQRRCSDQSHTWCGGCRSYAQLRIPLVRGSCKTLPTSTRHHASRTSLQNLVVACVEAVGSVLAYLHYIWRWPSRGTRCQLGRTTKKRIQAVMGIVVLQITLLLLRTSLPTSSNFHALSESTIRATITSTPTVPAPCLIGQALLE